MSFRRVTLGAVRLLFGTRPSPIPGAVGPIAARGEDALVKLGRRGRRGRFHRASNQTM